MTKFVKLIDEHGDDSLINIAEVAQVKADDDEPDQSLVWLRGRSKPIIVQGSFEQISHLVTTGQPIEEPVTVVITKYGDSAA